MCDVDFCYNLETRQDSDPDWHSLLCRNTRSGSADHSP